MPRSSDPIEAWAADIVDNRTSKAKKQALTPFRRKLYAVLKKVPRGRFTTYGLLAKALASSPRAVGNGLRNNPFAPIVPCHRVVKTDYSIGGFAGSTGDCPNIHKKIRMLTEEGISFTGFEVADRARKLVFDPSTLPPTLTSELQDKSLMQA